MSTNLYGVSTGKPSAKPKHSLRQLAKCNQTGAETNSRSPCWSNSATMKPSLTQDSLAQQASTRVPHHQPPSAWNPHSLRTLIVPGVALEASTESSPPPATFSMKPSLTQDSYSAWGGPGSFHKSSPPLPTFSMKSSLRTLSAWDGPGNFHREFPTTSHLQHETITHTGLLVPEVPQEASTKFPTTSMKPSLKQDS